MRKVTGLDSVDSMVAIAEVARPAPADFVSAQKPLRRLLVLEGIQDPGNLGTLLRTATALGWDGAFLLPGCCDPFNDKALRASRGASFRLPWATGTWGDLERVVATRSLVCIAAEPDDRSGAKDLPESLASAVCLVLGAEGQGLSHEALSRCVPVAIPMPGQMESLNVAIAGSILMFALSPGMPQLASRLHVRL